MILLSAIGIFLNNANSEDVKRKFLFKKPLIILTVYLLAIGVLFLLSTIFTSKFSVHSALDFTLSGILSTLTSFGGGEAFLSVAQGVFVDNLFISADIFYKQIVPIANALPGPILVKILAGIGYVFGFRLSGNIFTGYLFSLLGISIGVGTSSAVFAFIYMIYHSFKSLSIFTLLKKWILPAICGLLLSTILSMLVEMLKTTAIKEINSLFAFLIFTIIIAANFILHKNYKLSDLILIDISGILSLATINIL